MAKNPFVSSDAVDEITGGFFICLMGYIEYTRMWLSLKDLSPLTLYGGAPVMSAYMEHPLLSHFTWGGLYSGDTGRSGEEVHYYTLL